MKKLRVGVIGLGMGKGHISGYRRHKAAEVVAIADPDAKRLEAVGERFKIERRYASGEAMIARENLDVVSVATPNKFHKPLTLAALKAGCHVLCEKPMAMNAREAEAMLGAARRARRRLMINFSYRFTTPAIALKKAVDSGALGGIYFGRTVWHRSRGIPGFGGWFGIKRLAGGGPLIDLGVHRLDLALWLMGYPKPAWVLAGSYDHVARRLARRARKAFDVEDLAAGMIKFTNGALLEVEASWAANLREAELMETRLLGTEGGLVQRNLNEGYEFEGELFRDRGGKLVKAPLPKVKPVPGGAMAHFIDCLVKGKAPTASGEEGLTVMRLLDAIYASAARGRPVKLA